VEEEQLNSSI
jgi:hypothetical protein